VGQLDLAVHPPRKVIDRALDGLAVAPLCAIGLQPVEWV
jgi:hypothetical protein